MKKLLFVLFMSMSIMTQAQDSISVRIPDTARLTVAKVYEDVKSGIQGLAQALKVPAVHVYKILVKQQTTYSIINICIVIGLFLCCLLVGRYAKVTYKGHLALYKKKYNTDNADIEDTVKGPLSVALTILSIALGVSGVIVLCITMQETIIGLTNPEYGAIKEIINFIK